jgi:hypothetical protein
LAQVALPLRPAELERGGVDLLLAYSFSSVGLVGSSLDAAATATAKEEVLVLSGLY